VPFGSSAGGGGWVNSASITHGDGRSLPDIIAAGVATGWNAARMAAALSIHRATLFRWLSHEGLTLRSLKESHESHESRDRRATGATLGAGIVS
jgi:hypothetical protein